MVTLPKTMPFNTTEQEAIILNMVWEMINDMVNYAMFSKNENTEDIELRFETEIHQRLFNIFLVDFLSQPQPSNGKSLPFDLPQPPRNASDSDYTYLFYLRQVCENSKLGRNTDPLLDKLDAFSQWLETKAFVKNVWFPSIDTELDLHVKRIFFIKICGNIAKHNFSRLHRDVRKICKVFHCHGHPVDEGQAYLILPEFYAWFHENLFGYHASTIAEFLNNIRWSIFEYIRPEFERSYEKIDPAPMYRYNYPPDIVKPIAQSMYWDLMNKCRSGVYFPRFTVSKLLKLRY